MRRLFRIVTIAFMCGILVTPTIEAQGRRDGRRGERTEQRGNSHRSSTNNQNRNNSKHSANKNNRQPNRDNGRYNQHDNRNHKPGKSHDVNRPNHNRPPKVGTPHHGHNHRPVHVAPPHRPHRPHYKAYHRPTPPPAFRPHRGCPVIHSILGLAFGSAINASLDYLFLNGYAVDGYGSDVVYLRNVNQLSLMWPDAVLYYGTSGLYGSRFSYSTRHYDRSRYNQVYTTFVGRYGAPIRYEAVNNGFVATWFGYDGGYVSLEFSPGYANDGSLRYFTTISFGL